MIDIHSAPERIGLSKERLARIKNWMQGYIDKSKLPGATTLIARHGEVVFSETLGYGDLEKKKPLTTCLEHFYFENWNLFRV